VRLIVSSLTSPGLHLLARVERKWGESISADRSAERNGQSEARRRARLDASYRSRTLVTDLPHVLFQ
jgi:hypothetical protein